MSAREVPVLQPGDPVAAQLVQAIHGGDLGQLRGLLARGAELNWVPEYADGTPLDAASSSGTRRNNVTTWLAELGARSARSEVEA